MSEAVSFISKENLLDQLETRKIQLIDVRINWEASQEKIKYAVHEDPNDVSAWTSKYDKAAPMVLYCSSPEQKISRKAAKSLLNQGFKDVVVLRGGWTVWHSAGLPVQRREPSPTPDGFVQDVLKD